MLESTSFKCKLIMDSDGLEEFSIILNPFGELYLEEDLGNQRSFRKIKEYVKHGGVFVNMGAFTIAAVSYGAGYLLLFGMRIDDEKASAYTVECIETMSKKPKTKGSL